MPVLATMEALVLNNPHALLPKNLLAQSMSSKKLPRNGWTAGPVD